MTQFQKELETEILNCNPRDIIIQHKEKQTIVTAPRYSSHSAIFDNAFRYIQNKGGDFRGTDWTKVYKVYFIYPKPKLTPEQKQANRQAKTEAKKQAKELAKIEAEKNQKPIQEITINIEWKRSKMWGSNPNCVATVKYKDGTRDVSPTYKASGCGYDKESTVIANVFNEYLKYKLHAIDETKVLPYGMSIRSDWKYYDGGIGTSCYYRIAEFIGGRFDKIASGNSFDVFKYTDEPKETN